MVASSMWNGTQSVWNLRLDHPIEAGRGGTLRTLGDVGEFILALPDALRQQESWQIVAETVLEAAKSRYTGPVTRAVYMALILTGESARLGIDKRVRACDGYHRTPWPEPNAREGDPLQSLASLMRDLAAARRHVQAIIGSVK